MDARDRACERFGCQILAEATAREQHGQPQGANVDRKKNIETAMANRLKLENRRLKKEAAAACE